MGDEIEKVMRNKPIDIDGIRQAAKVVNRRMSPSPLRHYGDLSEILGAEVHIKHENHNPTASFKIRGGINVMHHLSQAGIRGVISFSTGNHGTSVATSANMYGMDAVVVVPEGSNPVKTRAIKGAGAELIESGRNFEEAALKVEEIRRDRHLYFVHPADEPELVNGVGTCFLEVIEELPELDTLIVPLGAGSEVASAITVLKAMKPTVEVIAVQAEASPAAFLSWRNQKITAAENRSFAGGFATGTAYQTTFNIYRNQLSDFVLLSEDELVEAMSLALHHTHNLAEAAGAAPIIAAWKLRDKLKGKKVVLQMSGAKTDPEKLGEAVRHPSFFSGKPNS